MFKFKNGVKVLSVFLGIALFMSCVTKKPDPNFLGDFETQSLGKIMGAVVKRIKHTLKPAEISMTFSPRSNTVSMHHKYLGENIWVVLTEENRTVFSNALNQYLSEYKSKTLNEENNKKKGYFGKTPTLMRWGLFGVARSAEPSIRFEYELIQPKKRPYFIIASKTVPSFKGGANSPAIRIALSPAKCQDMLILLKQENLQKIVDELQKEYDQYEIDENKFDDEEFDVMHEIEESSTETDEPVDEDQADSEFNID